MNIISEHLEKLSNWSDIKEEVDWGVHNFWEHVSVNSSVHCSVLVSVVEFLYDSDERSNNCIFDQAESGFNKLSLLFFKARSSPFISFVFTISAKRVIPDHEDHNNDEWDCSSSSIVYSPVSVFIYWKMFLGFVLEKIAGVLDIFFKFCIRFLSKENFEFVVKLFLTSAKILKLDSKLFQFLFLLLFFVN